MMKTVLNLYNSNQDYLKIGNHKVERSNNGNIELYSYHRTVIFAIDKNEKTIVIDNGGWNTSSTTRAINDYKKLYETFINTLGYTVIDRRN